MNHYKQVSDKPMSLDLENENIEVKGKVEKSPFIKKHEEIMELRINQWIFNSENPEHPKYLDGKPPINFYQDKKEWFILFDWKVKKALPFTSEMIQSYLDKQIEWNRLENYLREQELEDEGNMWTRFRGFTIKELIYNLHINGEKKIPIYIEGTIN